MSANDKENHGGEQSSPTISPRYSHVPSLPTVRLHNSDTESPTAIHSSFSPGDEAADDAAADAAGEPQRKNARRSESSPAGESSGGTSDSASGEERKSGKEMSDHATSATSDSGSCRKCKKKDEQIQHIQQQHRQRIREVRLHNKGRLLEEQKKNSDIELQQSRRFLEEQKKHSDMELHSRRLLEEQMKNSDIELQQLRVVSERDKVEISRLMERQEQIRNEMRKAKESEARMLEQLNAVLVMIQGQAKKTDARPEVHTEPRKRPWARETEYEYTPNHNNRHGERESSKAAIGAIDRDNKRTPTHNYRHCESESSQAPIGAVRKPVEPYRWGPAVRAGVSNQWSSGGGRMPVEEPPQSNHKATGWHSANEGWQGNGHW